MRAPCCSTSLKIPLSNNDWKLWEEWIELQLERTSMLRLQARKERKLTVDPSLKHATEQEESSYCYFSLLEPCESLKAPVKAPYQGICLASEEQAWQLLFKVRKRKRLYAWRLTNEKKMFCSHFIGGSVLRAQIIILWRLRELSFGERENWAKNTKIVRG
jgi:hypothetical protein